MDRIFTEMFSRQPDEIIKGDYFYRIPDCWEWTAELRKIAEALLKEHKKKREQIENRPDFKLCWDRKTLHGEIDYF
ncbi:MAG: hypothetical protein GX254_05530 [Clostridiales bacterium]|mgnify:CR=1 FL=1|nr:hypothetical protein [Clostridiales bacterium]